MNGLVTMMEMADWSTEEKQVYSNTGKRKITALNSRLVSEAHAAVAGGHAEWGSFAGGLCTEAGFELKGYQARVTTAMIDLPAYSQRVCRNCYAAFMDE